MKDGMKQTSRAGDKQASQHERKWVINAAARKETGEKVMQANKQKDLLACKASSTSQLPETVATEETIVDNDPVRSGTMSWT